MYTDTCLLLASLSMEGIAEVAVVFWYSIHPITLPDQGVCCIKFQVYCWQLAVAQRMAVASGSGGVGQVKSSQGRGVQGALSQSWLL